MKIRFLIFVALLLPSILWAQSGSRGGKLQSLRPLGGSMLAISGAIELLDETEADSKKRVFRVYLVGPAGDSIDLKEVESCTVEWRTLSKVGRLQDDLKNEKAQAEKEGSGPIYSFSATGEVPNDPEVTLEVTIALPNRGGTGVATFSGIVD